MQCLINLRLLSGFNHVVPCGFQVSLSLLSSLHFLGISYLNLPLSFNTTASLHFHTFIVGQVEQTSAHLLSRSLASLMRSRIIVLLAVCSNVAVAGVLPRNGARGQ